MSSPSARFLLDANLSPRTTRFLTRRCGIDVIALQGSHLGQLSDRNVIRKAKELGRVLITLDRDYSVYFNETERPVIGIIYLRLPNTHRNVPAINAVLERFFLTQAPTINFDMTLVTITEDTVLVVNRS